MTENRRVALITGASRGIGAGLARYFHDQGVHLALCARSPAALPDGERVYSERFDICESAALKGFVERAVERFGHIDVWINNAGVLDPIMPLRRVPLADFKRHIDINLTSLFVASQIYANHIRDSERGGVLINISSGASSSPYNGWSTYCAGKAAVDMLSRCLQAEEADAGLRVHAVAPGIIDTDMQEMIRQSNPDDFPAVEAFVGYKERAAFSTPEFVAEKLFELSFSPGEGSDEVVIGLPAQFPDRF